MHYSDYRPRTYPIRLVDNMSGFIEGNDGQSSTTVLGLASNQYSVVLHSGEDNVRLTAGKSIYLDAPDGDVLFKVDDHGNHWYSIGTAFFQ